ncbi:hypothetical protein A3A66_03090 [Microgenomates group bacterium RIFCSPLOWO2_01_FULL_46_13]|nr:MAG: hypothetical protein A2783_04915 [Microgenomates group bacterium RIFCSPHIGHO2_01_FULL_45_11]OGV94140.1 MAG: hypothetical protein A3A66_03090 [Microgenomates group bacterium RIFCSPLOWO2_01_FULL_46_13]
MDFKQITSPDGQNHWIPKDLTLVFPKTRTLDRNHLHFLVYIPWEDKYFEKIPPQYREFFKYVLSYLKPRTTDVHIACVFPFLKNLTEEKKINERVIALALILHDSGWSQLSEQEIAASLGVSGLKLTKKASAPKEKHALEGLRLAKKILSEYHFTPPLTAQEKHLIYQAVRYHDQPEKIALNHQLPEEVKILIDLDHLWSFTFENFWQDTVRKGVDPASYLGNLKIDLAAYFVTDTGKKLAKKLWQDRRTEVTSFKRHLP